MPPDDFRALTPDSRSHASGQAISDYYTSQTGGFDGPHNPSGSSQRSKPRGVYGLSLTKLWREIVNEIRRLRRHDETTIYERHRRFNDVPLCVSLITFPRRSADPEERNAVESDISKLFVEDPIVYQVFQHCKHEITLNNPYKDVGHFERPESIEMEDARSQWSTLLAYNSFRHVNEDPKSMRSRCDALKVTIRFSECSLIAINYLPHVLAMKMQGKDLEFLLEVWNLFLSLVSNTGYPIWKSNMDLCFKNILYSGKSISDFASPLQFEIIAKRLVEYANEIPFILDTFFAHPTIEFGSKTSPYGARFVYPAPFGQWNIATASSYAVHFLRGIKSSTDGSDSEKYLQDGFQISPLDRTVFVDLNWMQLYQIVNDALQKYRHVEGIISSERLQNVVHRDFITLVDNNISIIAGANVTNSKNTKGRARSNFFISQSVDIDRYCKHEMLEKFGNVIGYSYILNDRLHFQAHIKIPNGIYVLTFIPQFRNVPYLRRFRIGGKYFISTDGLPEPVAHIWSTWSRKSIDGDLAVDTMLLDGHVLSLLHVVAETLFFDCKGHYPILAGYEMGTREPLYVAVVRLRSDSPWHFTTVKDGATSVKYTDEVGEEHIELDFFVLALRHDPTDIPPPKYSHLRTKAKDPTGPVYWLKFWPRKDPQYTDREVPSDDRLLEPYLDALRERKRTEQNMMELLSGFR
ncbi:hypothetical protein SCHPADRAFT_944312 [Schizopora paradoxa]|uniref:Uncharacterized protein n=1 Tax=Schizopora paradoxa TaxID=27342 RepID=A0A0H2R9S8_9AGAM|nr:hypothetical protein SCHPADRAFT_944312 [Schizopora paradoxa]